MVRSWKLILSLTAILLLQGVGKFLHLQHDHADHGSVALAAASADAPSDRCSGFHDDTGDADPSEQGSERSPTHPEEPGKPHDCDLCQMLGSARADLVALERPAVEAPEAEVQPVFEPASRTCVGAIPLPRSSRGPPHA